MFKKILVPIDGSECSKQALGFAADFAKEQGATLAICSVLESSKPEYALAFATPELTGGLLEMLRSQAEELVSGAVKRVSARAQAEGLVRDGLPAEEIVKAAQEAGCDIIVMGSHGRRGLAHFFLGSVAEEVLRTSPVPVLIMRRDIPQGADGKPYTVGDGSKETEPA